MARGICRCSGTELPNKLNLLHSTLLPIWSRETSAFPFEWSEQNPAIGQCRPTARLVQALYGGHIVLQRLEFADGIFYHFVNEIYGRRYDLTEAQMTGETFTIIEDWVQPQSAVLQLELFAHVRRPVVVLFEAFTQHTGIHLPLEDPTRIIKTGVI